MRGRERSRAANPSLRSRPKNRQLRRALPSPLLGFVLSWFLHQDCVGFVFPFTFQFNTCVISKTNISMCRCISKTQKNRQDRNLCFRRAQLNTTCCHSLLLDLNNLNCHARRARAATVIICNAVIKGSFQRETLSIDGRYKAIQPPGKLMFS